MDSPVSGAPVPFKPAAVLGVLCAIALAIGFFPGAEPALPVPAQPAMSAPPPEPSEPAGSDGFEFQAPTGSAARIDCAAALGVVAFARSELATPVVPPVPAEFAESWRSSLDPHGLWSAAPDSPLATALGQHAGALLTSLGSGGPGCMGADAVGLVFQAWLLRLSASYDAAFDEERASRHWHSASPEFFQWVAEPIFEDDPVTRPGLQLAAELGRRLSAFSVAFPEELATAQLLRSRLFPDAASAALAEVALAAALRAYLPLVDPHAGFAALTEESALYAGDATLDPGSTLWGDVVRTALGARVVSAPLAPLELDDLVLAVEGFTLAGASIEQIEQAARVTPADGVYRLRVLRQGEGRLLDLRVVELPASPSSGLRVEQLRYGGESAHVLRIEISDVADGFAEELELVLDSPEAQSARGVLLDLRGNAGGSMEAAVEALGLVLPGAPLFPLIHRGAVVELLRAPRPLRPFGGPLAALVDGDTASAAEMLAGAVQAYGRGPVLGRSTFGKGCAQEYFDDVAPAFVLRLTTLQFVLPNGQPLQQVGLAPDFLLPLPAATERESDFARQPIVFEGPDVRDLRLQGGPSWPPARGQLGPCSEPVVCEALARLSGSGQATKASARAARPRAIAR